MLDMLHFSQMQNWINKIVYLIILLKGYSSAKNIQVLALHTAQCMTDPFPYSLTLTPKNAGWITGNSGMRDY